MKARLTILALLALLILPMVLPADARRRMTPLNTAATTTQSINETANDTSRINAKRRANSVSYVDNNGKTIYVDTLTGQEWTDSTIVTSIPKMEYPLFHALSIGVNVWDPVMRAFGQKYGIADAWVELSLHNRYKPIFEAGLGLADNTPSGENFTYRSPLSVYFRIGANYNFLYNSNPDYSVFAGLRYGFSPFSYSIDNVTVNNNYWDESLRLDIPSQRSTAGWIEVTAGVRVKLWGPLSAGWTIKYQSLLHESKAKYGKPWYIPGYGSRSTSVTGSFSLIYTFGLGKLNKPAAADVVNENDMEQPVATTDTTLTVTVGIENGMDSIGQNSQTSPE